MATKNDGEPNDCVRRLVGEEELDRLCEFLYIAINFPVPSSDSEGRRFTESERELFRIHAQFLPDILFTYIALLAAGKISQEHISKGGASVKRIIHKLLMEIHDARPADLTDDQVSAVEALKGALFGQKGGKRT